MAAPTPPIAEGLATLADGRSLGYACFGDPDGFPVFWFHGTPGARRQIPPDGPNEAADRGVKIIGVERPGTGWSTPHRYRQIKDWAADIAELADHLGHEQFCVVGLSGGGPYVLACAHELPNRVVAGAVLGGIGPVRGPDTVHSITKLLGYFEPFLSAVAEPIAQALPKLLRPLIPYSEGAIGVYARIAPASDRKVLQHPEFKAMFIDDLSVALAEDLRAPIYDLVLFARDWGFSLRDITVPVAFWQGDADGVVPPNHCPHQAALVPNSSLTMVPDEGHFAGFTNVTDVLDHLQAEWEAAVPADA